LNSHLVVVVAIFMAIVVACGGSGEKQVSPALRAAALTTPEATAVAHVDTGVPPYCVTAEQHTLQDITTTPSSPYFVQHPESGGATIPTVIFMSGGVGSRPIAQRVWANYLSNGDGVEEYRLVIPYFENIDLIDGASRVFGILDEVLACYGGDPSRVHIAGTSNGGLAAYALMLASPDRFATLLGAPGAFPTQDLELLSDALSGKRVFNGVGEADIGWMTGVKATHDQLVGLGIDSRYVEFASQSHQVSPEFDESIFFEFWSGE
jgi:predicted esterase